MAASSVTRFYLVFHVPPSNLAACKSAIFAAGAGRYQNYTECCWSSLGTGQFRPGDAANPHIGKVGALEEVPEVCVETLCAGEDVARRAVKALKEYVKYTVEGLLTNSIQGPSLRRAVIPSVQTRGFLIRLNVITGCISKTLQVSEYNNG
jgi:hypothetical protein